MKPLITFFAVLALLVVPQLRRAQETNPTDQETTLRYLLPVQDLSDKKTSAARWGLAAPIADDFSNPNAIVYDQTYIDTYISWAEDSAIVCGEATYWIETSDEVIEVNWGLDQSYLGQRFRADG